MRDITVTFAIDDEIEKKLDQLLPLWQNWTDPDTGRKPFLGYEKDRLFQDIMECGCVPYAKEKLASFETGLLREEHAGAAGGDGMSRDWTDAELQAASEAMKTQGHLSFPEFKVELGLAMLLDIMKEHHCSKAKLAEALGVSRQSVSQVFKGTQYFTVRQIRTMAEMFSMTPEQVCECFALL